MMQINFDRLDQYKRLLAFIPISLAVSVLFSFLLCVMICLLFAGFAITTAEAYFLFTKIMMVSWVFMVSINLLFKLLLITLKTMQTIPLVIKVKK